MIAMTGSYSNRVAAIALDSGLLSPAWAGSVASTIVSDESWLQAMVDVEVALVRAQSDAGVVPSAAAKVIEKAAAADRLDLAALAVAARESGNPVVGLVQALTALVASADEDAANYLHRGATSQDIFDTAAMLVAARSVEHTVGELTRVAALLAELADAHRRTPMAGRTLTQHAVPTTFGLKVAGWLVAVMAARERLLAVRAGLPVQLGGAAGTLAAYLEYATASSPPTTGGEAFVDALTSNFARRLGLTEPVVPWHSLRGCVAELGSALALTTGALGKIAVDVLSLARTEVGELAESSGETARGTSSAMPHKRNPVLATMIRSAALQVPPLVTVLSLAQLAEDERAAGVWQSEWQPLRECLRLSGGAAGLACELVAGLEVDATRMASNLAITAGLVVSERLVVVLTPLLGKPQAKALVTKAAVQGAREGTGFSAALLAAPELAGILDAAQLAELMRPDAYLGAADLLVEKALASYRRAAQTHRMASS
jgi:nitrosuccinate lyase